MRLSVPFYSQHDASIREEWRSRACGVTVLVMALAHLSDAETPNIQDLIDEGVSLGGYSDGVGWKHDTLVDLAKAYGANASREEFKEDKTIGITNLKERISGGAIPIVSIAKDHADTSTFHLVVVTGFSDLGFYYNDSSYSSEKEGKDLFMVFEKFEALWRGLVIFIKF